MSNGGKNQQLRERKNNMIRHRDLTVRWKEKRLLNKRFRDRGAFHCRSLIAWRSWQLARSTGQSALSLTPETVAVAYR